MKDYNECTEICTFLMFIMKSLPSYQNVYSHCFAIKTKFLTEIDIKIAELIIICAKHTIINIMQTLPCTCPQHDLSHISQKSIMFSPYSTQAITSGTCRNVLLACVAQVIIGATYRECLL